MTQLLLRLSTISSGGFVLKIEIYGPLPLEADAMAKLLAEIPEDAKHVIIQAPPRNSMDRRACQHPGWLFYTASVDNQRFIHLSQSSLTAPFKVVHT